MRAPIFPILASTEAVERGAVLAPRFDGAGLIAAVATHALSGEVLMLAWMDAQALELTLKTGEAHYFSRSRRGTWKKGETSGQVQAVQEVRIDCDQDAVWLKVIPGGDGGACHTGERSCFYRVIENGILAARP
ncbi:MAG TPA: phosphoribosyl-AMP cyclohydrolase [Caulobacteraceae bacterium]